MNVACVANLDDIQTIRMSTLVEKISELSDEKLALVSRAVAFALDMQR